MSIDGLSEVSGDANRGNGHAHSLPGNQDAHWPCHVTSCQVTSSLVTWQKATQYSHESHWLYFA